MLKTLAQILVPALAILFALCASTKTAAAHSQQHAIANFGTQSEFFFGIGTAPAHVEDELEDNWIQFARDGKIFAFKNQFEPEKRNLFWSAPATDINLVSETGAKVFRMGLDWGRLAPNLPGSLNCNGVCPYGVQNRAALAHYKNIVSMARARGLSVMISLFHHSMPTWALPLGGFTNPLMVDAFEAFTHDVVKELASEVDMWVTINEPSPFLLFTYVEGMWPGGPQKAEYWQFVNLPWHKGTYPLAFQNLVEAHRRAYKMIHQIDTVIADPNLPSAAPARVGIAHIVMWSEAARPQDIAGARFFNMLSKFSFPDEVASTIDFLGLNYYGREIVKGFSVEISPDKEFSDSGRNIYPQALYWLLKQFHARYNVKRHNREERGMLPIIITENGIADSRDIFRPSYIIEHLLAIAEARKDGVPVEGLIHWTITDNMEWLDGYCPKFGLTEMRREEGFRRIKRNSYHLFSRIAQTGVITQSERDAAWNLVQTNVNTPRPMCRSLDGKTGLDKPIWRPVTNDDWRFRSQSSTKK